MSTAKTILGGEDVRAIIADCGSHVTRVGSAGDDTPRTIMPTAIGTPRAPAAAPSPPAPDTDVAMTDVAAPPPKPADPHAEFVGAPAAPATPAAPAAPPAPAAPFRPRAGDALLTAPLAFTDVQPGYEQDALTGCATVRDWDAMQAVWEASCHYLRLTPRTSPLLIVEPSHAWDDRARASALERAFEGMAVPAAYVARGSAMAAFAAGRTTACVVDIGHQGGIAVPVLDGYTLQKSKVMSTVGGWSLSEKLRAWTEAQLAGRPGYDGGLYDPTVSGENRIRAHHELRREPLVADAGSRKFKTTDLSTSSKQIGLTESHRAFYRLRIIEDLKASTFRVSQGKTIASEEAAVGGKEAAKMMSGNGSAKPKAGKKEESGNESTSKAEGVGEKDNSTSNGSKAAGNGGSSQKSREANAGPSRVTDYELPDGNVVSLSATEGLSFADDLFVTTKSMISLPELAFRAVSNCDVDCRRDLFGGVVVTGGTSLIPGALERFSRELAIRTPQMYKLKVLAATNSVERSCGAWIGGSIVASLGTFQQAWISKAEYDELGSTGSLRKCP